MKRKIVVTAVGGRSVGSGILHALKRASSEASARWHVIGTDADPFAWGLYVADEGALLPFASHPDYLSRMLELVGANDVAAIIPGSEPEAEFLAAHQSEIPVPVITNRLDLMPLMMDKFAASAKLHELGLPVIETFPISQWEQALVKYDFPFIVKPTVGTGGSRGLNFVVNRSELETLIPQLPESGKFCIQPFVGSGDEEFTVGVLTDKDGVLIDSIVMKRKLIGLSLLQSRSVGGKSLSISTGYSQGYFVRDPQIQTFCETLAVRLGSRGPLNIQLRRDGDTIYVFEIHPRFSGTSTMRADVGFNEPDILLRNILDKEKFGRLNYQSEVAAIRAFEHVIVPIDQLLKA